jgi:rfaE bifunctional protein nucleotidyltransferase chain/domain
MMPTASKVKNIEELATEIAGIRSRDRGKTVVQCHGVFDLLHIGHIRHFEQAKAFGEVLVVTVTPDQYVNKGPHRPAFSESLRVEALAALDCVDYVAINQWPTAVEAVRLIKPDVYAKGADYRDHSDDLTGKISDEEDAVKAFGGRTIYTDDITFSSSNLINTHLSAFSPEVSDFLAGFSERFTPEDAFRYLNGARGLKVLVVGETIIDEYVYCEMLGKSTKEPVLAGRYISADRFAGGILAIANHVANFSDDVGLATMVGAQASEEDFVRSQTNARMDLLLRKSDSPTIVKRRFVEAYLSQKLFEVYEMNDDVLDRKQDREFCLSLEKILPRYDVVIVADYGHGMITPDAVDVLCGKSRFLAVNTQSNAGNRGFNTISKYPRADYVCLASHEIALETKSYKGDPRDMVLKVSDNLQCERIIITLGSSGSLCYGGEEGFAEVPAFASRVVDRIGAGDSVLSLTALCVAQQAPMEMVGFIGNVAGAQAVATVGHAQSLERIPFSKHIESLMK